MDPALVLLAPVVVATAPDPRVMVVVTVLNLVDVSVVVAFRVVVEVISFVLAVTDVIWVACVTIVVAVRVVVDGTVEVMV